MIPSTDSGNHGKPDGVPPHPGTPVEPHPPGEHPHPPTRPIKHTTPFGGELKKLSTPHGGPQYYTFADLGQWWSFNPKRWAKEEHLMAVWYPQFSYKAKIINGMISRVWYGTITPWADTIEEAAAVLDRLEKGLEVHSCAGKVVLPPGCAPQQVPIPAYLTAKILSEEYQIKVIHRAPPAHPRAWLISPKIPSAPHRYLPEGAICPLTPHEREWSWETHSLVDYIDAIAVWLIKVNAYIKNGYQWIGGESSHKPQDLAKINPHEQCWCGSGRPYGLCCKKRPATI